MFGEVIGQIAGTMTPVDKQGIGPWRCGPSSWPSRSACSWLWSNAVCQYCISEMHLYMEVDFYIQTHAITTAAFLKSTINNNMVDSASDKDDNNIYRDVIVYTTSETSYCVCISY
jgi:hypothetical protein